MILRIATIYILTGTGHFFTVFSLKYLFANSSANQFSKIGELDAGFQLMFSLIALGLQTDAIRTIAVSENWKNEYEKSHQARITLSFFLCLLGLLSFYDKNYL